jgi:hypothetical protein
VDALEVILRVDGEGFGVGGHGWMQSKVQGPKSKV